MMKLRAPYGAGIIEVSDKAAAHYLAGGFVRIEEKPAKEAKKKKGK